MFDILTKYSSPPLTFKASSFIGDWEECSFLYEEYGLWNYHDVLFSSGIDTRYESLPAFDFFSFSSVVLLSVIQKLVRAGRNGKGELERAYSEGLLDIIFFLLKEEKSRRATRRRKMRSSL